MIKNKMNDNKCDKFVRNNCSKRRDILTMSKIKSNGKSRILFF